MEFLLNFGATAVWPLTVLLLVLYIFNKLRDDLQPILTAMVNDLAKQVGKNSLIFFIAFLFGLTSSLNAFAEIFAAIDKQAAEAMSWWQFGAVLAKALNPFIGGFLGYLIGKGIIDLKPDQKSNTVPPFPPPSPSP